MPRSPSVDLATWPALMLEGNLIAPAMVARIDRREAPEQTEADYGVRKGLTIREEISLAFRVGQAHYDHFTRTEHPGYGATLRFVQAFLTETLGFTDLGAGEHPVALQAGESRIPMVVVPPEEALDRRSATLSSDRSRAPSFSLQDDLNSRDDALWGLVTNGTRWRLMRDNASLTRPAFIEVDLAQVFTTEDIASFAIVWLLLHRSRFGRAGTPSTDCALERWRDSGSREGEAARDRLSAQVEEALRVLGTGFLTANPALAERLHHGRLDQTVWFNELLRLVYRLIFLMVAEDRELLHPPDATPEARQLYVQGYSLMHLRAQAVRRASWDRHHDRYEGLKVVFRALADGEPRLGLPALGGLFRLEVLEDLMNARLSNRACMEALWRLSWLSSQRGMVPINWRAMETEELGSVYESLLELQPQLIEDGRALRFASDLAERKGSQRKTTGSYYTPDSLVQALLDIALDPVLDRAEAEADDPEAALLRLSVIDPACGSGHFLLAVARRIATRVARIRAEGTPSLADFRHALRDVARSCLYGVDRNPMAVELTKVALWIETVDPGRPLGFLDAQIRCGDSLLGVLDLKALEDGIPDAAYKPLTGDDKNTAKYYLKVNRDAKAGQGGFDFGTGTEAMPAIKPLATDFFKLRSLPEDTLEQIGAKAERFTQLRSDSAFARTQAAADLFVAAFLLPKTEGPSADTDARVVPTTNEIWLVLGNGSLSPRMQDAQTAARRAHVFHWPLEFPDVLARGGFDVVLGNPPWDSMSPDYKEFFSVHDPNIRHMSPDEQAEAYARLLSNAVLAEKWEQHCTDLYGAVHFIKASGRYRLFAEGNLGKGDFNIYRMFVETALAATKPGGVAAQFVPEGLYNGANATAIRRHLFSSLRLEYIAGFENTKGIWFPKVHTAMKFCMYVAWKDGKTSEFQAMFRVSSHDKLQELLSGGGLNIPFSIVEEFSPDAVAVMEFASQSEINASSKMYARQPRFGVQLDGVPYRRYMREVDMGTDRDLFSSEPAEYPLFEGRMVDFFDYRAKGYVSGRGRSAMWQDLQFGDPKKRIQPQWYIPAARLPDKLRAQVRQYRIGYCNVTSPTNSRSFVACLIPPNTLCGHSVPTISSSNGQVSVLLLWLAVLNSFAVDFLVRKRVSLNIVHTITDSLPLPRHWQGKADAKLLIECTYRLVGVGKEMQGLAETLGKEGFLVSAMRPTEDEDERAVLRAKMDALVASKVFGLTEDELIEMISSEKSYGTGFKALEASERNKYGFFRSLSLIKDQWGKMEE